MLKIIAPARGFVQKERQVHAAKEARGFGTGIESAELCRKEDKVAALIWLVREVVKEGEPTIVFASTRHHVEFLHTVLQAAGMNVTCVYGAMDQVRCLIWIQITLFEQNPSEGEESTDAHRPPALCSYALANLPKDVNLVWPCQIP